MRKATGVLTLVFAVGWLALGQTLTGVLWLAIGFGWLAAGFLKPRKDPPLDRPGLARRFSRLLLFWS